MNKFKITIILVTILVLMGCLGGESPESGDAIGGVMRSDDGGKSFVSKSQITEKNSLIRTSVLSLEIDPTNGNILYAGTKQNGLFTSEDNGEIWRSLNFPLTNIEEIVVNTQNVNNIYVSGMLNGRGAIYRTDDKGGNFRQVYIEPNDGTNITAMTINPNNSDIIYAGLNTGLLIRTSDGGETWEDLFTFGNVSLLEVFFDAQDSDTIYVLNSANGVFKSRDGAKSFENVLDLERYEDQGIYEGNVYSLAVNPSVSGSILVGTDKGVFQSKDYGRSWEEVDTIASVKGIPIYALKINPHNTDQIVFAAAKAVYTEIDGNWAVTDTTSNLAVNVIKHNPVNNGIVYLGMMSLEK